MPDMSSEVPVVRADVGDGKVILVEARTTDPEEDVGVGDLFKFDGVEDSIRTISERVVSALKGVQPDRASVEFGIDVSVESGALTGLLAKGTGGATLKVTLEWGSGG